MTRITSPVSQGESTAALGCAGLAITQTKAELTHRTAKFRKELLVMRETLRSFAYLIGAVGANNDIDQPFSLPDVVFAPPC
jgi:hypothetical protein